VALGNWGSTESVPTLTRALADESQLVRAHAAWALGSIGGDEAGRALEQRSRIEADELVRREISLVQQDPTSE
jgi:epoxyqueuosine reductase